MRRNLIKISILLLLAANLLLLCVGRKSYDTLTKHFFARLTQPSVKIFVTYYKPYKLPPKDTIFVPIQVGRAIENEPYQGGKLSKEDISWLHENMIGDDTGDNISAKNREFDVLTAYYWVWKNYKKIGSPKYIGFFAHRKWLVFGALNKYYIGLKNSDTNHEFEKFLDKYKVVAFASEDDRTVPINMYEVYQRDHNEEDFKLFLSLISQNYPDIYETAQDIVLDGRNDYAVWNYWIMEKSLAFDYFEKLFRIMFEFDRIQGARIKNRDAMQRRAYGYLAERFFAIWLEHQMRFGKVNPYMAEMMYR